MVTKCELLMFIEEMTSVLNLYPHLDHHISLLHKDDILYALVSDDVKNLVYVYWDCSQQSYVVHKNNNKRKPFMHSDVRYVVNHISNIFDDFST